MSDIGDVKGEIEILTEHGQRNVNALNAKLHLLGDALVDLNKSMATMAQVALASYNQLESLQKVVSGAQQATQKATKTTDDFWRSLRKIDDAAEKTDNTLVTLWNRFGKVVLGFTIFYRAMNLVEDGLVSLVQKFISGAKATDDFNQAVIQSSAAFMAVLDKQKVDLLQQKPIIMEFYRDLMGQADIVAAKAIASSEDIREGILAMTMHGIVPATATAMENLGIIVDAVKIYTRGIMSGNQVMTELRAVMEGTARQGQQLALVLRGQLGPAWKEMIKEWRAGGSENFLAKLVENAFPGIRIMREEMMKLLKTWEETAQSAEKAFMREVFQRVIPDIVDIHKWYTSLIWDLDALEKGQRKFTAAAKAAADDIVRTEQNLKGLWLSISAATDDTFARMGMMNPRLTDLLGVVNAILAVLEGIVSILRIIPGIFNAVQEMSWQLYAIIEDRFKKLPKILFSPFADQVEYVKEGFNKFLSFFTGMPAVIDKNVDPAIQAMRNFGVRLRQQLFFFGEGGEEPVGPKADVVAAQAREEFIKNLLPNVKPPAVDTSDIDKNWKKWAAAAKSIVDQTENYITRKQDASAAERIAIEDREYKERVEKYLWATQVLGTGSAEIQANLEEMARRYAQHIKALVDGADIYAKEYKHWATAAQQIVNQTENYITKKTNASVAERMAIESKEYEERVGKFQWAAAVLGLEAEKVQATLTEMSRRYQQHLQALVDSADVIGKEWNKMVRQQFTSLVSSLSSTFAGLISGVLKGEMNSFLDFMTKFKDLVIQMIAEMIAKFILLKLIGVETSSGFAGGLGSGLLNALLGTGTKAAAATAATAALPSGMGMAFAEGGILNETVWGRGRSGQRYVFGEAGAEAFMPLSKVGGGGFASSITVNVAPNTAGSASAEAARTMGREIALAVRAEVNRTIQEQVRPGGFLNPMGMAHA